MNLFRIAILVSLLSLPLTRCQNGRGGSSGTSGNGLGSFSDGSPFGSGDDSGKNANANSQGSSGGSGTSGSANNPGNFFLSDELTPAVLPSAGVTFRKVAPNTVGLFTGTSDKPPTVMVKSQLQRASAGCTSLVPNGYPTYHYHALAACPKGYLITGGGASCQIGKGGDTLHSMPEGNGWYSDCCVYDDGNAVGYTFAICALTDPTQVD